MTSVLAARRALQELPAEKEKKAHPSLQRGMTGPAVAALQNALVKLKYLSNDARKTGRGVFGPRTEEAVKRIQQQHGLVATGVWGPRSSELLAKGIACAPHRDDEEETIPPGPI
jgi:peptidoglycan hydrolase-like protein with peptidoglycan-binding domain